MATKHVIRTDQAPAPFQGAPYSQGIRFGERLRSLGARIERVEP